MNRRVSHRFEYDLKRHGGVNRLRIAKYSDRSNQLARLEQRIFPVIPVGIALEHRIGSKVELRDERLMARGANFVMNVLAHARGIVPGPGMFVSKL